MWKMMAGFETIICNAAQHQSVKAAPIVTHEGNEPIAKKRISAARKV
jgi:hypothetical protein